MHPTQTHKLQIRQSLLRDLPLVPLPHPQSLAPLPHLGRHPRFLILNLLNYLFTTSPRDDLIPRDSHRPALTCNHGLGPREGRPEGDGYAACDGGFGLQDCVDGVYRGEVRLQLGCEGGEAGDCVFGTEEEA